MSDDNSNGYGPFDTASPSAPEPASTSVRSRRRTGRRLAVVATGTTIALGAGGIAWAATDTPTPTPSSSTPGDSNTAPTTPEGAPVPVPNGDGDEHFGGHGPGGGPLAGGPLGGAPLHGEIVVETSDGVYETIATQRGTVDEISADEVTVTSEDGFTRTYALTADSLESEWSEEAVDLAVGDDVMVVATVDGATVTVTRAIDLDALPPATEGRPFHRHGLGERGGPSDPAPDESPEATPEASVEGSAA